MGGLPGRRGMESDREVASNVRQVWLLSTRAVAPGPRSSRCESWGPGGPVVALRDTRLQAVPRPPRLGAAPPFWRLANARAAASLAGVGRGARGPRGTIARTCG